MIFDNIRKIQARIRAAQERSGRSGLVEIVAVTKQASEEDLRALVGTGLLRKLGESKVQAARERIIELRQSRAGDRPLEWHMIGRLQTNKARPAALLFDVIESLDSLRVAQALERALEAEERTLPVLVQVKLSSRETQGGLSPGELPDFLSNLRTCPRLRTRGLMAIAPRLEPVSAVRPHFQRLRALFERHFDPANDFLSMGMSRDFEIAVEEGANLLRLGAAIFEPETEPTIKEGAT